MMVKKVTLFLLLLFCLFVFPQNKKLDDMSFGEIEKKIDSLAFSKKNAFSIINFYIKKAKKEKNQEALVYAYRYATKASDNEFDGLRFADSAIIIAKRHNNTKLLSEAFFNKGVYLMDNFRNAEALDNILIANKYSIILKDLYIQNKTLYYIAQNKILLGQEDSAISDLKKCISYFKKNLNNSNLGEDYNIYFVYSLISIIDSNSKLGYNNQDYFNQAFSYIDKTGEKNLLPYFISSKGINFYFTGDYQKAIKMLSQAIKLYNDIWPHYTEIFYIGLSYWKLGQKDKADSCFF